MIYLDNSATTKPCKEAVEAMTAALTEGWANPSALYGFGIDALRQLKVARSKVAAALGAEPDRIFFTSGGTEADNWALLSSAKRFGKKNKHIITTAIEHHAILNCAKELEAQGYEVTYLQPNELGQISLDSLKAALRKDTFLVSVMMVNNETGAVYNIPAVKRLMATKCPDALLHVDATQGYMKIPFTKAGIGADLITVSSHKIGGPKGVGALIIDRDVIKKRGLAPVVYGGGQGIGLRSGTENVAGVAAFAEAARLAHLELKESISKMSALRERLVDRLANDDRLCEISPTLPKNHAPHILNVTLPGIKSETMLHYLSSEGIFVSSGSACSSNGGHLSSALTSYGRSDAEADSSIRISFSKDNSEEDVDALTEALAQGLTKLARIKR